MLICFIQSNQGRRDSLMHEFSFNVNKVNRAVATVRTIGDRLPLSNNDLNGTFCFKARIIFKMTRKNVSSMKIYLIHLNMIMPLMVLHTYLLKKLGSGIALKIS